MHAQVFLEPPAPAAGQPRPPVLGGAEGLNPRTAFPAPSPPPWHTERGAAEGRAGLCSLPAVPVTVRARRRNLFYFPGGRGDGP